ncbi:deoxyhypusine synthase [Plakobranchus ocellatus]|uniref:Deoxyhypusine synthase n=1 Tax=Plakobranchus ocellatus TaxID=259542 RepID=A0AAV3ZXN5_9GAST|nr:deoxyhypusine synthase [Plakobranchus ocellatus]
MGKCYLNPEWLSDPKFSEWLMEIPNEKTEFKCKYCSQTYIIGQSGIKALISHMDSKKHAKAQARSCGSRSLLSYAKISTNSTSSSATQSPGCVTSKIDQPGPTMPNTDLPLESRPNSKQPAPLKVSDNVVIIVGFLKLW